MCVWEISLQVSVEMGHRPVIRILNNIKNYCHISCFYLNRISFLQFTVFSSKTKQINYFLSKTSNITDIYIRPKFPFNMKWLLVK